jgi:hypothetical protein
MARVEQQDLQTALERWCDRQGGKVDQIGRRKGAMLVEVDGLRSAVELVGSSSRATNRTIGFRAALMRVLSRLGENDSSALGLAVPVMDAVGLADRRALMPTAWTRIAEAFPELSVWYVDHESGEVTLVPWADAGGKNDPIRNG